jgi:hypothetical protein
MYVMGNGSPSNLLLDLDPTFLVFLVQGLGVYYCYGLRL